MPFSPIPTRSLDASNAACVNWSAVGRPALTEAPAPSSPTQLELVTCLVYAIYRFHASRHGGDRAHNLVCAVMLRVLTSATWHLCP